MGGSTSSGISTAGEYDKGLVQKMVLIILKCVALTTREARYVGIVKGVLIKSIQDNNFSPIKHFVIKTRHLV